MTGALDVGSYCIYRGEFGVIIDAFEDRTGAWWIVEMDDGRRLGPMAGDPYLAPLDRQSYVRAILTSVAARHLPIDRAAALIDLVTR